MGEHKITLAVAFLQTHPDSAAEMLEKQPADEVATLLAKVPSSHAAQVLRKIIPKCAAFICTELDFEVSIAILIHLAAKDIVAILRYIDSDSRERFIEELPIRKQVSCKLMLGYSEDMVGAYVTTTVSTVPSGANAKEALRIVRSTKDSTPSDFVFVVNREMKLKGCFQLIDLLRCPDEFPVISLIKGSCNTIQGRRSIREISTHPDWMQHELIAVLNRSHDFIGVLRYADLRKALEALDERFVQEEKPELIHGIAQGYGESLLALFQSMKEFGASDLQTWKGSRND